MRIEWRCGEAWIVDQRLRQVRRYGAVRVDALLAVLRDRREAIEDADDEMDQRGHRDGRCHGRACRGGNMGVAQGGARRSGGT